MSSDRLAVAWARDRRWRTLEALEVTDGIFSRVEFGPEPDRSDHSQIRHWILPGLIDSHVHLAEDPTPLNGQPHSREPEAGDVQRIATVEANLAAALRAGITTLRDVGSLGPRWPQVKEAIASSRQAGRPLPRIFTAGEMLTTVNGHGTEYGRVVARGRDLPATVAEVADQGADFIKVINDPICFSLEELRRAVEVAADRGLPVSVHTYTDEAAALAISSGARNLEHPGRYSTTTINRLVATGMAVTTTFIAAFDTVADPRAAGADTLFEEADLGLFSDWYLSCCQTIPVLAERGVDLALGTDAGFPGTPMDSLHREIASLRLLNLDMRQLIVSATEVPANLLGMEGRLGTLVPGAAADWLSFTEDPLTNPRVLRSPAEVWLAGKLACCASNPTAP